MAQALAPFRERDLTGFKYVDRLLPMLEALHAVGSQRDRAGNRVSPASAR